MNKRILFSLCGGVLIFSLILAVAWAYWNERPSEDAWIVEQPEQLVSGAASGQELHVDFILRNISSRPRRILGVEAC